jgi:hypothetical protein
MSLAALGYQQIVSLSSATALSPPTGANAALIHAEGADVRWRDDGTAPSASVGMLLPAGGELYFDGSLSGFRAIQVSAGAKINISYYG